MLMDSSDFFPSLSQALFELLDQVENAISVEEKPSGNAISVEAKPSDNAKPHLVNIQGKMDVSEEIHAAEISIQENNFPGKPRLTSLSPSYLLLDVNF